MHQKKIEVLESFLRFPELSDAEQHLLSEIRTMQSNIENLTDESKAELTTLYLVRGFLTY